jgi:uncharacterized protein
MNIVELNRDSIATLCLEHHVEKLYSFGSLGTNRFTKKSDIDLLVTFENIDLSGYFDNYINMKKGLEALLKEKLIWWKIKLSKTLYSGVQSTGVKSLYIDGYKF